MIANFDSTAGLHPTHASPLLQSAFLLGNVLLVSICSIACLAPAIKR